MDGASKHTSYEEILLPEQGETRTYYLRSDELLNWCDAVTVRLLNRNAFLRVQAEDKCFLFCEPYSSPLTDVDTNSPARRLHESFHYFAGGKNPSHLAGWITYEYGHELEDYPRADPQQMPRLAALPSFIFYEYRTVLELNPTEGRVTITRAIDADRNSHKVLWDLTSADLNSRLEFPAQANKLPAATDPREYNKFDQFIMKHSRFSKDEYEQNVIAIKDKIRNGDVYQVNLSNQFTIPLGEDTATQKAQRVNAMLAELRSAPRGALGYYAGCQVKGANATPFILCSLSPELLLESSNQNNKLCALCRPIKGTRPRAIDPREDERLAQELLDSAKDEAELAMIVDLTRNDLHRVAVTGSVKIASHAALKTYPTVHHLESAICATIASPNTLIDLIEALFPFGSITGAPKIAAMRDIAQRENTPRGIWSGTIGFISPTGASHLNVAIRTALFFEDECIFNSGGGVTIDSDPQAEFIETLVKARCWMPILRLGGD